MAASQYEVAGQRFSSETRRRQSNGGEERGRGEREWWVK